MAMAVHQRLSTLARAGQTHSVSLLPNARSPFKDDSTPAAHRLAMLKLATADTAIAVCELELWQTPPVYTIDTLRVLRQRYPDDSLIFVMGADSAASLPRWKQGLQLTDYGHLWLFARSTQHQYSQYGTHNSHNPASTYQHRQGEATTVKPLPQQLAPELQSRLINDVTTITSHTHGGVYIDTQQPQAVSSTVIRQRLQRLTHRPAAMTDPSLSSWLDDRVLNYIHKHGLYVAAQQPT